VKNEARRSSGVAAKGLSNGERPGRAETPPIGGKAGTVPGTSARRTTKGQTGPRRAGLRRRDGSANSAASPRIGFHAPIAGGLQNALLKSHAFGCDTVQIFSRNPRGWYAKPLAIEDVATFRRVREETNLYPVVIHCNYLVNLAAADLTILEKSRASFREEIERSLKLGVNYLVVHPGSARGACETDGIRTCAESLMTACEGLKLGRLRVLLENTAGQGECIGHRFEHLGEILKACRRLKLGVCLDTAHAFTAGYDIRDEDGFIATMEALRRNVGLENVRAVHFNDSKADYNSRVDRHWHIGEGRIGSEALRRFVRYPGLAHAAFLLETPQDEPGDDLRNLEALRSFMKPKTNPRSGVLKKGDR
jgi:deoxyribonuclease IV